MTYRQMKEKLDSLPQENLDQDATVLCMNSDEVIAVMDFVTDWTTEQQEKGVDQVDGILDNGHPYLTIGF